MTIAEKQERIVAEYAAIQDPEERYRRIIARGRALAPMAEELKTEERRVRGCASQVWLAARSDGEHVLFQADSDAIITKGLIALLLDVYDREPPEDIIAAQPSFIERIGLNVMLTPNRANGLVAMITHIKRAALDIITERKRRTKTEVTPLQNPSISEDADDGREDGGASDAPTQMHRR